MDRQIVWCSNPDTHLVTNDFRHGYDDFFSFAQVNNDSLILPSGKH